MADESLNRRAIEQRGRVLSPDEWLAVRSGVQLEAQVEARGTDMHGYFFHAQPVEPEFLHDLVGQQVEAELEQRIAAGHPLGLDRLDHHAERHVLVTEQVNYQVIATMQQVLHRSGLLQVHPHHEGIGEEAHHRLDLTAGTPGEHRPECQVVLARPPSQDQEERSREDCEQRHLLAGREVPGALKEVRRYGMVEVVALRGGRS